MYLILDTLDNTERLKSCIGVVVIMVVGFAFSRHPGQVGSHHSIAKSSLLVQK